MLWPLVILCVFLSIALIASIFLLVSERRTVRNREAKLKLLHKAMTAVRAGLFHYDVKKNISFWDEQSLKLFGLPTTNNMIHSGLWESVIHPDDLEKCLYNMASAMQGRSSTFTHSYRIVLPNNVTRWIEGTGYVFRDNQGNPLEISGFHFDITNQVVQQENLKSSESKALQSVKDKANLMANLSHEVRTPLNAISGIVELLSLENKDSSQTAYLATLKNSSDLLLRITNDILDISKIEAGKFHLEKATFNLRRQLHTCLEPLVIAAEKKQLKLFCVIDGIIPTLVKADTIRLQQVLINLLTNAIKFTHSGFIILNVSKDDDGLLFSVRDTGIGIEYSKQKDLFGRFNQADLSTTRVFGGTGLGLAIVKDIVTLWQGEVTLSSEPNQGTTVAFTLPIKDLIAKRTTQFGGKSLLITPLQTIPDLWNSQSAAPAMTWANGLFPAINFLKNDATITQITLDGCYIEDNERCHQFFNQIKQKPHLLITIFGSNISSKLKQLPQKIKINRTISDLLVINQLWDKDLFNDVLPRPNINQIHWPNYSDKTILCIDDNQSNLIVLSGLLRQFGIQAQTASSGLSAIDLVKHQGFDLVIMDYEMPNLSGPETARRINQIRPQQIIGLSAHTDRTFEEQAVASGMVGFISKPIRIEDLCKTLDKYFEKTAIAHQS